MGPGHLTRGRWWLLSWVRPGSREELLAEGGREPVDEAVVGPAVVGDQGAVGGGAGEGEHDVDRVSWLEAGGERAPPPARQKHTSGSVIECVTVRLCAMALPVSTTARFCDI